MRHLLESLICTDIGLIPYHFPSRPPVSDHALEQDQRNWPMRGLHGSQGTVIADDIREDFSYQHHLKFHNSNWERHSMLKTCSDGQHLCLQPM